MPTQPQTDPLAEVSSATSSCRCPAGRDTEAVPKSDRHALLDAIARTVRQQEMEVGEAA
jgi:hypothetical protein